MSIYLILTFSLVINVLLGWYITRLLRKFIFISENLSDLFLTTKAFQVFIKSLYSMDTYRGEPMIQELILRIQEVSQEIEVFRDTFQYSLDEELDQELEEELNAAEEAPRPSQV